MMEEWRPVKGYEGIYEISNLGRVKSLKRLDARGHERKEKIMKQQFSKERKKPSMNFQMPNGEAVRKSIHIELAKAFMDDYFDGCYVSMINNDFKDVRLDNLRIENKTENRKRVRKKVANKIKDEDIEVILKKINTGTSCREISLEYNVSKRTIERIKKKHPEKEKRLLSE